MSRILRLGPRILRDDPADGRLRTLACYLGLELRSVLKPAADGKPRRKRILDAQIEFFDYRHLRYIFVEIFLTRDYLFTSGTARPFIVDCGANLGMSIVFFKRLYPECKILAFEPDPETFSLLKGNVEANGFEDVTLVNKAVSSAEGVIEFYSDRGRALEWGACLPQEAPRSRSRFLRFDSPNTLTSPLISSRLTSKERSSKSFVSSSSLERAASSVRWPSSIITTSIRERTDWQIFWSYWNVVASDIRFAEMSARRCNRQVSRFDDLRVQEKRVSPASCRVR